MQHGMKFQTTIGKEVHSERKKVNIFNPPKVVFCQMFLSPTIPTHPYYMCVECIILPLNKENIVVESSGERLAKGWTTCFGDLSFETFPPMLE